MRMYSFGLRLLYIGFSSGPLAVFFTAVCRIWSRHYRWRTHLAEFQFDGVIDGGANIGEFAGVVRDVLPTAHLICVEPHPDCAAILREEGYEVIEAALWNEKTVLQLTQDGPSTSSTVMASTSGRNVASVQTVRLEDIPIQGKKLLVKLDLQGAEPMALRGLGALEKRCAGFLVEVSLSPTGTYRELQHFFESHGYVQFASINELFSGTRQIEADILWIQKDILAMGD